MNVAPNSSISKIASDLLQLGQQRQQQLELHLQVSEDAGRVRNQAVDQSMATLSKQAQAVQDVKQTAQRTRSPGQLDVWA